MEPRPPVMATKVCKMVHVVFFMIRKGVKKSKFVIDLHLLLERGKIVGKALNDLMIHHNCTLGCRSHDMQASFISPGDYEFSCSNIPAFPPYIPFHVCRRKVKRHAHAPAYEDDVAASDYSDAADVSPLVMGPVRRRVRVTDSPFPLRDDDKDCHVDKEAEEFIQRFYKQLRLQTRKAG